MSRKEALVEEELYRLVRNVLDKHSHMISGVRFGDVTPQRAVDGGIADLVLSLSDGTVILEIECKRKVSGLAGAKPIREFDPLGSKVVTQALDYAVKLGSHTFATTNGERFALFRTPTLGEPFRYDTHRLTVKDPFRLEEKYVDEVLSFLAKWYAKVPVRLIGVDWLFISRVRSFVDFLSNPLMEFITKKLKVDETFSQKFEAFSIKIGGLTGQQLARETAYLLMNRIVFYKILERHYEKLRELKPISAPDGTYFMKYLNGYFAKAIEVTGDFEPIFTSEFYDDVPLPDSDYVFDEINSLIEEMNTYRLEEVDSDVVGYIYEELIPDEERHRLGQFYTPPPIAELIVKWSVRTYEDRLMDPAAGSGTFLVKAYRRLFDLKSKRYKKAREKRGAEGIHKEILSQIYGDDINPFPSHLTAMNLAMRDVRDPTSELNIIVEDFFSVQARSNVLTTYRIKSAAGEARRSISLPQFDAVVANPPYTRWVEIPEGTQNAINRSIGELLKHYGLSGGIGNETGIYIHFIMHSYSFLRNNGRLAMIVSNSWLQSDYGVNFANFLLDHFKVKAIIDFNQRLFRIPLIATCVILLEREDDQDARLKNEATFIYVHKEARVEEILDAVENPGNWRHKFLINIVKQSDLPRNEKWIRALFNTVLMEQDIQKSKYSNEMENLFEPNYGNISGVVARGGTGADKFFYMTKYDSERWGLAQSGVLRPLLTGPRYNKFFSFSLEDWQQLENDNKPCYVFVCHQPSASMPENVRSFIRWGEETPLVRIREGESPRKANESMASKMRERSKAFYGWYDLGDIRRTPIFTSRRAQYYHRFALLKLEGCALDDGFITFVPRGEFTPNELMAQAAYLNSDFHRFFVEIFGRSTGGGVIELDDKSAGRIPVLDCRKLPKDSVEDLASLFTKLESKARVIRGADTQQNLEVLQPIVEEIDAKICEIIGLKNDLLRKIISTTKILSERRTSRIERAKPDTVVGEGEHRITPPKRRRAKKVEEPTRRLTSWM